RPAGADLDLASLRRTLTIRSNEGFVEAFGAALVAAAAAEAPHLRLRFTAKPSKSAAALRDGSAELEIGVLGEMGPEVRLQALFRDRFVGVVRQGHALAREDVVSAEAYAGFGHVVASRHEDPRGPVDDALAELGLQRAIVAVVPGFPAALAIARGTDLVALVPASFLVHRGATAEDGLHVFELPVSTARITVSQMWHPRLEADPVHRWLRQRVLAECRRLMPD
ncbi:LysR substrate-binding domain-containing protein, partial [Burkholderia gladioli]